MIIYCDYGHAEGTGANRTYYENSCFLEKQKDAKGFPFNNLLKSVRHIKDDDVLFTNSGPYAWKFHHLRKKHRKRFRIVRDSHTTLWSGYLLQEDLCIDFMKEGDMIIFPSEFTRQTYIKLFPHITKKNSSVVVPIPKDMPDIDAQEKKDSDSLRIGWLGKLSRDKGFEQALEIFVAAKKGLGKDVKFCVCGVPERKEYNTKNILRILGKQGIGSNSYSHLKEGRFVSRRDLWSFLSKIDVLLFPSSSNLEACPKVLLESCAMGIPVLASEHGGGYGFVPKKNLIKTHYFRKTDDLIYNQSLGKVDIEHTLNLLSGSDKLKASRRNFCENHESSLLDVLHGKEKREPKGLGKKTKGFIKNIRLFINKDYKRDIAKANKLLLKDKYYNLGKTPLDIVKGVNFGVYARLN